MAHLTVSQKVAVAQMSVILLAGGALGIKWITYNSYLQSAQGKFAFAGSPVCTSSIGFAAPTGCVEDDNGQYVTPQQYGIEHDEAAAAVAMRDDVWAACLIAGVLILAGLVGQLAFH